VGYVKQNKGVSFMFEPDIKDELEKGTLKVIFIEEGNIIFFTDLIYHSEKSLSPPSQAFLRMVGELRGQGKGEFRAGFVPPSSVLQTY
jgi:DNA-binding transcriptional LysR family regulator